MWTGVSEHNVMAAGVGISAALLFRQGQGLYRLQRIDGAVLYAATFAVAAGLAGAALTLSRLRSSISRSLSWWVVAVRFCFRNFPKKEKAPFQQIREFSKFSYRAFLRVWGGAW